MHPFEGRPPVAFWRTGVADLPVDEIGALWKPKWPIGRQTRIATFGSCFAQQFGGTLRACGFYWVNGEPAPSPLSPETRKQYSYEIFSARTGNIYTARQLLQWLSWAVGDKSVPEEVWEKDGRYYDPFRPSIEPNGFISPLELSSSRRTTLICLLKAIRQTDLFVFTMGLTESWRSIHGYEYQSAPGVFTDDFDPRVQYFHNQGFLDIHDGMGAIFDILRKIQPNIKILLTVSPVPITATASEEHVLVASSYTKSTLRAVAGQLHRDHDFCDYFPGYEMITGLPFRSMFYKPNLRNVTQQGVSFVMDQFLTATGFLQEQSRQFPAQEISAETTDPLCDETILEIFAQS